MALFPKLSKRPKLFRATTGISLARFQQLLPQFEALFAQHEAQRKSRVVKTGAERQRKIGGGAHFATELPEQLLMLLLYYRLYLTQEFMTLLFQVDDKSTICRAIKRVRPVFEGVLPVPERAQKTVLALAEKETERRQKQSNKRIGSLEEFTEAYPELTILIDGTEQPKQRPKDKTKRKDDYSGKKKRHTLKQIITTTPSGIILDQSAPSGGRRHDFALFKEHVQDQGARFFAQLAWLRVSAYADSGFTGMEALMEQLSLPVETRLVVRARRGHPLCPEQKTRNRVRSRTRIRVEHVIGHRKKYRIASSIYRGTDETYEGTMTVVAGLVNLRAYDRIASKTGMDLLHWGD